jgi:hypothetical protein
MKAEERKNKGKQNTRRRAESQIQEGKWKAECRNAGIQECKMEEEEKAECRKEKGKENKRRREQIIMKEG